MCKSIFLILRIKIIPVMVARRVVENVSAHYVRVFHNISCIKKSESPNHQPSEDYNRHAPSKNREQRPNIDISICWVGLFCALKVSNCCTMYNVQCTVVGTKECKCRKQIVCHESLE